MKLGSGLARIAAVAATASFVMIAPAAAAMRTVDGQNFWTGDPGPVDPGAYYESGQERYDPHHYLSWYGSDPQNYKMTVYGPHSGPTRCVWRKRVINSDWEFRHPYIRVCN
jgi:hypothetical protein